MRSKFLKIAGVMVLLIAVAGFWGYDKYFKPDLEIQHELTSQFGEDFFTSFDGLNAENNPGTVGQPINQPKTTDDTNEINETPDNKPKQTEPEPGTIAAPVKQTTTPKEFTLEEINNKYKSQFSYLQSVALSRLDTLYSAAVQEYAQRKKEGTINRSALAQKYIQAGNMLEANMDRQFSNTLNAMQAELIANNLPTDLIDAIESEYENAKSDKRSQLLSKLTK
ncbi:hypothetical protein [Desulfosporosinus sp.]|uniref:hypothetical protein n=1 Tax=Desulfosporosinus sp. TaxID=157907 RepID=UPI0025C58042|nr:hypothetical protein [Desulfosporosinus sp.]MBC2728493.1 hypothetical protein [Desulfosporosinus sp.]